MIGPTRWRRGPAQAWILMLVHRRAVDLVQRTQRQLYRANDETADATAPSAAEAVPIGTIKSQTFDRPRRLRQLPRAATRRSG